ncbi:MAG TPA: ABC transporter substrate-binding protein [Rhodospirillales bacterium]|nr:ABC transporter substrate-binding protein [Rhodospirillales bacterium]
MRTGRLLAGALGALLALGLQSAVAGPPDEPLVLEDIPEIGMPGGQLRMLVNRTKDTRLLYVYGHARLVNYAPDLTLFPDILKDYTVEDGRIFTFYLRPGHRWSDGEPFTTEDFRFWWEDVALNEELSPTGPPIQMVIDGELPKVEILGPLTIRYSWSKPNPFFLPKIAAASPIFIYAPAHYLKQFHKKYVDPERLAELVAEDKARDWVQLFLRRGRMNKFNNPDLPTLQPWMLTTRPPAERFIAVRNPYFHRVDKRGQQLPYIDRVILEVVDKKLIPIKTGAGETDLQARGLAFRDYTFLKESEPRSGLRTLLWREARGARYALYPNLNAADPVWQKLFRDRRFRLALSLSVDRDAVNQYFYFGLATPANNTILPDSPLYRPEIGEACLGYDIAKANALLDEIGLTERRADGTRLLPDGRPLELVVETAGESTEQTDILELLRDDWAKIGFRIHTKPSEREVLRNRIFSGEALMTIWFGIENGVPTADMSPQEFAPTSQYDQPQWPKWGQYYETKGKAGEPPALPEAKRLLELFDGWRLARSGEERRQIWDEMLTLYASQCYTIGLVANVLQPVAARKTLRNIPEDAIYNWEPHAQLGVYRPDTFFYATE